MLGAPVLTDWQQKADVLRAFAVRAGATVLLKGTPTLIAPADGGPLLVMANGTAALATGGSGDLLSGIIGALLAQGLDGPRAALLGATAHGRAAAHATALAGGEIRGITLEEVLDALPVAWQQMRAPRSLPPGVLHELPDARGADGPLP
jgi:NAD(P)H-hydrate repair Nnr-like enzyme with NAD(P)H-hydrate dehydratase domain